MPTQTEQVEPSLDEIAAQVFAALVTASPNSNDAQLRTLAVRAYTAAEVFVDYRKGKKG